MSSKQQPAAEPDRYQKQRLFAGIGDAGQERLRAGRVLICGCGALGSVIAETLVRAGVGFVRIVDRDFVELSNLQRQVLFDERDVVERLPKAVAAAEKLREINSLVEVEPIIADIDFSNVRGFVEDVDLILDGTDNFEVRFLINDAALETGTPWIYAGCIGSHGQVMAIFPGVTGCLRCLMGSVPDPGTMETCDTAGVLGPAINVVASLEAVAALKILTGQRELVEPVLLAVDVWDGTLRAINVENLRDQSSCPACHQGERAWLSGDRGSTTTVLCGRNAVQVSPRQLARICLPDLAQRLRDTGAVNHNQYLLRLQLSDPDFDVTVFKDGRAIISGTEDLGVARGVYSRYIGL